jgi:hypothetical protein
MPGWVTLAQGDTASMSDTLWNLLEFAFVVAWIVPLFALYFRCRTKQVVYLRRFPPIDQYRTLDVYRVGAGNPPGTFRRINEAMDQPQEEPELERMRREVWRLYRRVMARDVGFPVVMAILVGVLVATCIVPPPP